MPIKVHRPTFDQILSNLRVSKFDVRELSGVAGEVLVEKNGVGAILKKSTDGKSASLTANPGFLLGGEINAAVERQLAGRTDPAPAHPPLLPAQ